MESQPPPKRAKPTTDDDEPKGTVQEETSKTEDSRGKVSPEKSHEEVSPKAEELPKQERILSPLERLPNELAWMLIEYAPEAVFKLRLVSFSMWMQIDMKIISGINEASI